MSTIEFNNLLLNNTEFLKPFALTLTRDNEQAKDLLQETLYRALRNKEKYHVGTNVKAWLYTIMRNIFINDYRRRAKQTFVSSTPHEYLLNMKQPTVPNSAVESISTKEIKKAIHQLPDIFKTPFQLYFDGYRYNEIASLVQEPLGTIKSRIHFARKLLKAQVERI